MSVYMDYHTTSVTYDNARSPHGANLYLGLVYSLTNKTKENLHLLDIGCGTGNHVKYLMDRGLQKATMFDANPGMLEKAHLKLKEYVEEGRVTIEQHSLPEIPYQDGSFDVVMCNQVLQHVTTVEDKQHTNIHKVLNEAYRVLKSNGVLLVNLCTPFQVVNGYWYSKLYPDAASRFAARVVEQKKVLSTMRDVGFINEGMIVEPLELTYTPDRYFQQDGVLHAEWRSVDSISATLTPEELKQATTTVQTLKEEDKLEEFMREGDSLREHIGQYAIYYGRKG